MSQETVALLEKHHGGPQFHDLMIETSAGRFSTDFWDFWDIHAAPAVSPIPRLLDLGTGPGLLIEEWSRRYPGGEYIGVDLMPYMLNKAQQRLEHIKGVRLMAADLHDPQLPLMPGSVDVAACIVLLHEMVQPIRLLQRIHKLLKPGGRLVIVDWIRSGIDVYFDPATENNLFKPDADLGFVSDHMTHFFEHNRYSADDLAWLLQHTGFKEIGREYYKAKRFVRLAAERI